MQMFLTGWHIKSEFLWEFNDDFEFILTIVEWARLRHSRQGPVPTLINNYKHLKGNISLYIQLGDTQRQQLVDRISEDTSLLILQIFFNRKYNVS